MCKFTHLTVCLKCTQLGPDLNLKFQSTKIKRCPVLSSVSLKTHRLTTRPVILLVEMKVRIRQT